MNLKTLTGYILLIIMCSNAKATSIKDSNNPFKVYSPSNKFFAKIDPEKPRIPIHEVNSAKVADWEVEHVHYFHQYFLADSGEMLAVVSWQYVQINEQQTQQTGKVVYVGAVPWDKGIAIKFFSKAGEVKEYRYSELCKQPQKVTPPAPIGSFWREWLASVEQKDDQLIVDTQCGSNFKFSLKDGNLIE